MKAPNMITIAYPDGECLQLNARGFQARGWFESSIGAGDESFAYIDPQTAAERLREAAAAIVKDPTDKGWKP